MAKEFIVVFNIFNFRTKTKTKVEIRIEENV